MTDRTVSGARLMAKILGRSERTIRRLVAAGRLHAWKMNGPTSPLTARRSDLERLRVQGCEE